MAEQTQGRLFISYSRLNKTRVYPFAEALTEAGIEVWIDREAIDPLDDFPARIRDGLAQCHALLAWYSHEYAHSSYCQKEFTAAWISARRLTRDVLSRILIVNPEVTVEHIATGDVGRQNYLAAPRDLAPGLEAVQSIRERLAALSGELAAVREFRPPVWHPIAQQASARFVGRLRELWAIHTSFNPAAIAESENANPLVQLRGLGGVGKSVMAIEYATRFSAAYPGGIHWLRAYGFDPSRPMDTAARERERRTQLENLAYRHDIPVESKDHRQLSRDLGRKLASGEPYLWVVDDLPGDLNLQQAFPEWCAPSSNGCTLLTTRSKDYDGLGSIITVDVLDPVAAVDLLTRARRPKTDRERRDAEGLAEDLGWHALALDVAGSFLLKTRDFASLRREVTAETTGRESDPLGALAAGLKGQLPGGHEKSIVATVLASVRQLDEQGLSLLRLAGELQAGAPIPLRLAREVLQRAFALSEQPAEDYLALAVNQSEMNSLAVLTYGGGGDDTFTVHTLVRYAMQHSEAIPGEAAGLRKRLLEAAVSTLANTLEDVKDIYKHRQLAMYAVHAKQLSLHPSSIDEVRLAIWVAVFEAARGDYRAALAIAEKTLPVVERVEGPDHRNTLGLRNNAALWIGKAGDASQALRGFREVLPDYERVLGPDHPDTLMCRSNIATWTGNAGNARGALRLFQELLPDYERVLGPDALHVRTEIARWTGDAGNAGEALRLFDELLSEYIRIEGPASLGTVSVLGEVAYWSAETHDLSKALRLSWSLLEAQERLLGRDHPVVLSIRNNIANWTGRRGDAHEALRLFRDLLPDRERVLGPDHPETLRDRYNIAHWTGKVGSAVEALRLLKELLPDRLRVLGPDHPDTLRTRSLIAKWNGELNDPGKAVRLFRELLPDYERVLGRDHPETFETLNSIAGWTWETGDTDKAVRLFKELLTDHERVLGRDHPETLRMRNVVAWASNNRPSSPPS